MKWFGLCASWFFASGLPIWRFLTWTSDSLTKHIICRDSWECLESQVLEEIYRREYFLSLGNARRTIRALSPWCGVSENVDCEEKWLSELFEGPEWFWKVRELVGFRFCKILQYLCLSPTSWFRVVTKIRKLTSTLRSLSSLLILLLIRLLLLLLVLLLILLLDLLTRSVLVDYWVTWVYQIHECEMLSVEMVSAENSISKSGDRVTSRWATALYWPQHPGKKRFKSIFCHMFITCWDFRHPSCVHMQLVTKNRRSDQKMPNRELRGNR